MPRLRFTKGNIGKLQTVIDGQVDYFDTDKRYLLDPKSLYFTSMVGKCR
jgi:hypothetical protein